MDAAAKTELITRYRDQLLPGMDIDELMNELVRAEMANQDINGHQYMEMYHQIGLIKAEIRRRVK